MLSATKQHNYDYPHPCSLLMLYILNYVEKLEGLVNKRIIRTTTAIFHIHAKRCVKDWKRGSEHHMPQKTEEKLKNFPY